MGRTIGTVRYRFRRVVARTIGWVRHGTTVTEPTIPMLQWKPQK
jgi:hypothetical protein